ncbi:MAG: DUF2231 domain-containing protein [bacterium]
MNIHPIFVHFPIALLTFYALFEVFAWKKVKATTWFIYVKATLLFIGVLSGFAALNTGGSAEDLIGRSNLIETHATFATASMWLFVILSLVYIIGFILESAYIINFPKLQNLLNGIQNYINKFYFLIPAIAFIGLIFITITGALGGAIVYGPDIDPIVSFVYHLFF